jgi:hypothetical protein
MSLTLAFFTPSIHGHSNAHLTILRQLLKEAGEDGRPSLDIHVLGDEPVRPRIQSLPTAKHASITFHSIGDEDLFLTSTSGVMFHKEIYRVPPSSVFRRGGLDAIRSLSYVFAPSPALYLPRYARILDVLKEVKPALFVVDVLYQPLGADVARHGGFKYMLLSPLSSLDTSLFRQPHGKAYWKYPMLVFLVANLVPNLKYFS